MSNQYFRSAISNWLLFFFNYRIFRTPTIFHQPWKGQEVKYSTSSSLRFSLRDFLGFSERAEAVLNLGADDLSDANFFFYYTQTNTHLYILLWLDNNAISRRLHRRLAGIYPHLPAQPTTQIASLDIRGFTNSLDHARVNSWRGSPTFSHPRAHSNARERVPIIDSSCWNVSTLKAGGFISIMVHMYNIYE